jgi:hypothetical protein
MITVTVPSLAICTQGLGQNGACASSVGLGLARSAALEDFVSMGAAETAPVRAGGSASLDVIAAARCTARRARG